MNSHRTITISASLLAILGGLPPSRGFTHQVDYNGERGEYCYTESYNLGLCLGRQQKERLDFSEAQLLRCTECSGKFNGDETCEELKALNDVGRGSESGTEDSINWNDSFCETYNMCVEMNCPEQCMEEQDAWIECLVIELDCDWRCNEGEAWSGTRVSGMMGDGTMASAARSRLGSRWESVLGGLLFASAAYGMM